MSQYIHEKRYYCQFSEICKTLHTFVNRAALNDFLCKEGVLKEACR